MGPEPHDEDAEHTEQLSSHYTGEMLAPICGETLPG